jgi:orsellinic acid C2-O-methyltransferase
MPKESMQSELPPQAALYHLATGHYVSQALCLAARLGIADLLKDGPRHAKELAEGTGTHASSLHRVMRLLANAGIFEEQENGSFALTALGACLREGVPGSMRAMVMLYAGERMRNNWQELEYCVRTGAPVFRKRGLDDPFKDPARSPEDNATFDAAMADVTRLNAVAVVAAYDFAPFRTVVDVGGGNGTLLISILQAYPHLHGMVFDQPHAVDRAQKQIAARGLTVRCEAVAGDFFKDVPIGADAYILQRVIQDWDDDRAVTILTNCHRAMGGNGTLLLVEGVYPPRIDQSFAVRRALTGDVNMLVNTGGRWRSEAEFRTLYDAAGFTLLRIVPTQAEVRVIEGVRK